MTDTELDKLKEYAKAASEWNKKLWEQIVILEDINRLNLSWDFITKQGATIAFSEEAKFKVLIAGRKIAAHELHDEIFNDLESHGFIPADHTPIGEDTDEDQP